MADFGGFSVTTPQEVLAQMAQQRQAIASMPPGPQQNNANIQFQMANLFGNPELKKARKVETAIKGAQDYVKQAAPGTKGSLEHEATRLQAMYDAVGDFDPDAASQIQHALLGVREAQRQEKRLKANDARAEGFLAIQKSQNADRHASATQWDDYKFAIVNGKPKTFDLTNPEALAEYDKARRDGAQPITQEQAYRMFGADAATKAIAATVNKSDHGNKVKTYEAKNNFFREADTMGNLLMRMPEAGTKTADMAGLIMGLVPNATGILKLRAEDGSAYNADLTESWVGAKLDNWMENNEEQFAALGIEQSMFKSMVLNMGYVLARSLDSGGRLSDQDVNMAISMLTGSARDGVINPRIMASVLFRKAHSDAQILRHGLDTVRYTPERAAAGDAMAQEILAMSDATLGFFDNTLTKTYKKLLSEQDYMRVVDPKGFFEKYGPAQGAAAPAPRADYKEIFNPLMGEPQ